MFHKYVQEERHHTRTICTFKSIDDSETKACTYRYQSQCYRRYKGRCRIDEIREDRYLCLKVSVSYEHTNSSLIHARLFRTYRDAKHTSFQCAAYECPHSKDILKFTEDLEEMDHIECFYHPEKPTHVFMDSGSNHSGLIIFFFTFELLLVIVLTAVQIVHIAACFGGSKMKCKRNTKKKVKVEKAETFVALM